MWQNEVFSCICAKKSVILHRLTKQMFNYYPYYYEKQILYKDYVGHRLHVIHDGMYQNNRRGTI